MYLTCTNSVKLKTIQQVAYGEGAVTKLIASKCNLESV